MLDGSFLSDVLAKIIATVVGGAILTWLASFSVWVKTNKVPLFVGFLGGVVLTVSTIFIFFPSSPSPKTRPIAQAPSPQPSTAPLPEPLTPFPLPPKPEPERISESPREMYQRFQQLKNPIDAQDMAAKLYYGNYVEWGLAIASVTASGRGALIRSTTLETPNEAPFIYCDFDKGGRDFYRLESGKKALISGTVFQISDDFIHLVRCRVVKFL